MPGKEMQLLSGRSQRRLLHFAEVRQQYTQQKIFCTRLLHVVSTSVHTKVHDALFKIVQDEVFNELCIKNNKHFFTRFFELEHRHVWEKQYQLRPQNGVKANSPAAGELKIGRESRRSSLQEVESDLQIVLLKVLLLALLKVFLPKKVPKRVLFKVPLKGVSY